MTAEQRLLEERLLTVREAFEDAAALIDTDREQGLAALDRGKRLLQVAHDDFIAYIDQRYGPMPLDDPPEDG